MGHSKWSDVRERHRAAIGAEDVERGKERVLSSSRSGSRVATFPDAPDELRALVAEEAADIDERRARGEADGPLYRAARGEATSPARGTEAGGRLSLSGAEEAQDGEDSAVVGAGGG